MKRISDKELKEFMQRLSPIIQSLETPTCVAMSYGGRQFYIANEATTKLTMSDRYVIFSELSTNLVHALLGFYNKFDSINPNEGH